MSRPELGTEYRTMYRAVVYGVVVQALDIKAKAVQYANRHAQRVCAQGLTQTPTGKLMHVYSEAARRRWGPVTVVETRPKSIAKGSVDKRPTGGRACTGRSTFLREPGASFSPTPRSVDQGHRLSSLAAEIPPSSMTCVCRSGRAVGFSPSHDLYSMQPGPSCKSVSVRAVRLPHPRSLPALLRAHAPVFLSPKV